MDSELSILKRTEAAALLGVSPATLDPLNSRGVMPGPLPGSNFWSRVQLERAAAGQTWVPPDPVLDTRSASGKTFEAEYNAQNAGERHK